MTKKDIYNIYIKSYIKKDDIPFNRQLFSETIDFLQKQGLISEKRANTINHPKNKFFK